MDSLTVAQSLVTRFERMVRRDGSRIRLIGVDDSLVRIGYVPGTDPECAEGVCVLPEMELQAMMAEVLTAQAPALKVKVEREAA